MITALMNWYHRYLSAPEAGHLLFILFFLGLLLSCFGYVLAPVLISIVIAYLLDSGVRMVERYLKFPHAVAVLLVFSLFIAAFLLILVSFIPLLISQLGSLIQDLPDVSSHLQQSLMVWRAKMPYISDTDFQAVFVLFKEKLVTIGQAFLAASLASVTNIITFIVYFIMIPLLIYFFLMDRKNILAWCSRFLPDQHTVLAKIWLELDKQIGNYVRGKCVEALIVGVACYAAFAWLGLSYAALLAAGVGLSVFIPYIGAVIITIPVLTVALWQWGLDKDFLYLLITYSIILILDGTVLFSVLFSEANELHPVVIIIATLVFGAIWGFWGVFFAIPLASLTKALLAYWPINE